MFIYFLTFGLLLFQLVEVFKHPLDTYRIFTNKLILFSI